MKLTESNLPQIRKLIAVLVLAEMEIVDNGHTVSDVTNLSRLLENEITSLPSLRVC